MDPSLPSPGGFLKTLRLWNWSFILRCDLFGFSSSWIFNTWTSMNTRPWRPQSLQDRQNGLTWHVSWRTSDHVHVLLDSPGPSTLQKYLALEYFCSSSRSSCRSVFCPLCHWFLSEFDRCFKCSSGSPSWTQSLHRSWIWDHSSI